MISLTDVEKAMLAGAHGEGAALAMRVVVAAAELVRAPSLVEIRSAHIDGCLYHGDGGVEFAEALDGRGARVAVPTTLNVGALDLLHPGVVRSDPHATSMARRQMDAYVRMGAAPTFTCAPYQVGHEPGVGDQVAWGESNAIAFVNSVLGARTERYGDFLDACCAVTGRAPLHGLHVDENRKAEVLIDASKVPRELASRDVFYPVLGSWLGLEVGRKIAAIRGLPRETTRDQLKALGAAAASTGAVALFHVVGVTPEAPTVDAAMGLQHGGGPPGWRTRPAPVYSGAIEVTSEALRSALARLSTAGEIADVDAVAVGSPHFSVGEFEALHRLVAPLASGSRRLRVPFWVCTARDTLAEVDRLGWAGPLREAGVEIIVDTCVVVAPILPASGGVLMTNSGKFAHYGPANTGYDVVYGSLEDCVASAVAGRVVRDEAIWRWDS